MKPKTAIFLVLVLLACVVFVAVRKLDFNKVDQSPAAVLALWPADADSLTSITITDAAGTLALEKRDGQWRMTSPLDAQADEQKAAALAHALAGLQYEKAWSSDDPDRLDDSLSGLDKPSCTVDLTFESGPARTLYVGKPRLPQRQHTYVRPDGDDRVYLAIGDLPRELAWKADDYRDKQVISIAAADARRIRASGSGIRGVYDIALSDGDWIMHTPAAARASKQAIENLLANLRNVEGEDFIEKPGDLAGYGLDDERTRLLVEVWVDDAPARSANEPSTQADTQPASAPAPESKRLWIAFGDQSGDKVFARAENQQAVFCLKASLPADLIKALGEVRDPQVVRLEAPAVSTIELSLNEGPAVLRRQDGQWLMEKPYAGPANAAAVNAMLDAVKNLKAQRWLDATPAIAGMDKPMCSLRVFFGEGDEPLDVLIGASTSDGLTYVKTSKEDSVALVKSADATTLWAAAATYWSADLLNLGDSTSVERLVVTRRDGEFDMSLRDFQWVLTKPAQAAAHGQAVAKAISSLRQLKPDRVTALGTDVPARYKDATHALTVQIWGVDEPATPETSPATASAPAETQPATRPAPRLLGEVAMAKVSGKTYAWIPSASPIAVAEISEGVYDALGGEFHSRRVWNFGESDIVGLVVEAGEDRFELRRESAGWVNVRNLDQKIDSDKVNDYISDLAKVELERFMTYENRREDGKKLGFDEPWLGIELRRSQGEPLRLTISGRGSESTGNRYASGGDAEGIFVLGGDAVGKLAKKLQDFAR